MLIRDMFAKDIQREIKGVIKVAQDDEENRFQELEEYVVTRELLKHFSLFYQNYQKGIDGFTDEMGVWVSGFFGSGKSHFLKILSYLLDNEEVKGKKPGAFFKDKIADAAVYADIQRAARIDCETILFNIDSKSPLGIKSDKEAILKIFVKVFYDHLGFYGDDFKVAELEKFLKREGVLGQFQENYAAIKGETWLHRRDCFLFDEDEIVQALIKTKGMSEQSARNWFNHSKSPDISIEQFAQEVKEYIDSKDKNFHLVFLVDEIGQYIGDNPHLMLNLQTVAEDLGTHCKGKVWLIVTSQEDIDSVAKVKGNDFSKIQGRFKTRLSLSSASVDEVIKERILKKKEPARDILHLIYNENSAGLKNLIYFSDGTVADLKSYSSEDEFAATYPFVPYQFKLLQQVFNQIRKHGASGKHLSEGERSMLSAFQDAAKKFTENEQGILIPFYAFYDSVHEFLDGTIQRVITRAIDGANKGDGLELFDVDVLKLLFLIRYTGDIPANVDNIATLMVSSINEDKLSLRTIIKQSLNRLITQNYVQKNADEYRFLTDDEQDINREIENTVLDETLVVEAIGKYIFNDIYEDQKYKYNNRYNFAFNSKIDEKGIGNQAAKIGIRILTKASDDYDVDEAALKMASADKNDLIIHLDDNSEYFEEMKQALKIERFDKTKNADKLPDAYKRIIIEKQDEAKVRKTRAKSMLEEAITKASYYLNGEHFESHGSNVKERINNAMKILVEGVYNKLPYIVEFLESDDDIRKILQAKDEQLTLSGGISDQNYLASQELMSYIELHDVKHLQVTMKNILDKFEAEPYGWREIDIAGLVAGLFNKQKIRLLYKGSYLEPAEKALVSYLRKKTEVENLVVKKRVGIDPQLLKVAKDICKDLFDTIDVPADEDGIVKKLLEKMREKSLFIHEEYLSLYEGKNYPGKEIIEKGLGIFKDIEKCKADNLTLLTKLKEEKEALLDWDEEMLSLQAFFKNQRVIFDKGLEIIAKIDANSSYLQEKEFTEKTGQLREIIEDPAPYNRIIEMPTLTSWLKDSFEKLLEEKKNNSESKIMEDHVALLSALNQYNLSDQQRIDFKEKIDNWYEAKIQDIHSSDNFIKLDAVITQSNTFREKIMQEINDAVPSGNDGGELKENYSHQLKFIDFNFAEFIELHTNQDVDNYLAKLSEKLKKIINEKKIIRFK